MKTRHEDGKEKVKENKKFLLIDVYINRNVIIPKITDRSISNFYNNNHYHAGNIHRPPGFPYDV